MRFLIDENLGSRFAKLLSTHEYNIILVLITDDKDFGELVFRLKRPTKGIILLRTSTTNPEKLLGMVKGSLDKSKGKFIVLKEGQIRVRDLK